MKKEETKVTVQGVTVSKNHPDIKGKTPAQLEKSGLFDHIPEGEERKNASVELHDALNAKPKVDEKASVTGSTELPK